MSLDQKSKIPNQFHFVFGLKQQQEPFHLAFYLCLASCIAINKPDQIFFYYHYEPYGRYWDLIKSQLTLVHVELPTQIVNYKYRDRLINRYKYAHFADFIRLEKCVAVGGVYADIDTIFVNKIPNELFNRSFVLGKEQDVLCPKTNILKPSLCNAFIMSAPNAEFGRHWLAQIGNAFDGSWSKHACFLPQELSEQYPELVHIEPSRSFYRYMWSREDLHTLLEGYNDDYQDVISFHLWSHLWWEKRRKDFSSFHAGKLTEEYIRNVDTTYNIIARKFLPPYIEEPRKLPRFINWLLK